MEQYLIAAAIQDRKAFNTITKSLEEDDLSNLNKIIWDGISRYYELDTQVNRVDKEVLIKQLETKFSNPKHFENVALLLKQVPEDISALNIADVILSNKRYKRGLALAAALSANNEKEVQSSLQAYSDLKAVEAEEEEEEFVRAPSVESLIKDTYARDALIQLAPKSLNDRLDGGALRGHNVLVFARPEVGKTLFLINLIAGFLAQNLKVLYLANEEPLKATLLRIQSRLAGMNKFEVLEKPEEATEISNKKGYQNLVARYSAAMTLKNIRQWVEQEKPDVTIVDQLRNLKLPSDNRANQLELAAQGLRDIAGDCNTLMISTTQAGDSGENKLVLEQGDIDWSNCLAKGTEILMFDGSKKLVENIRVGELVMGMDGTPRTVKAIGQGKQPLYKISHKNGDYYISNLGHILTVYNSDTAPRAGIRSKELGDIPLKTLLKSPYLLTSLKGVWFSGREFPEASLLIEPYLFGLWLADGFSHTLSISTSDILLRDYLLENYKHLRPATRVVNIKNTIVSFNKQENGRPNPENDKLRALKVFRNKHIPPVYLTASRRQRLLLLAGLIDGDGSMRRTSEQSSDCYTIYPGNNDKLAEDILELIKSLGFYACKSKSQPTCWAVRLSGKVQDIPCVLSRKRATKNSQIAYLASNLKIEKVSDEGEYFGISVDADERYVLGNYIVTHNTGIPGAMDLMIGIGANQEFERLGQRMVNLPKNKLSGQHVHFPIAVNPSLNLVRSME